MLEGYLIKKSHICRHLAILVLLVACSGSQILRSDTSDVNSPGKNIYIANIANIVGSDIQVDFI